MKYKARIFNRFEFTHSFFRFLLADRIMIKKDNLVLVTGKRGDGKTTLSLRLILGCSNLERLEEQYNFFMNKGKEEDQVEEYKIKHLFKSFDIQTHMAFTREDLQDLCKSTQRGWILADEAIVNAARRNAMTRANKILHEVLTINRKNSNTVFFCLPSVEDFDISMLQYVTHWIHVDDRGHAVILFPEPKSIFGRRSWDIDKMKKQYDKIREENPKETNIPYWVFQNFRGYIRFGPLSRKVEKKYLKIAHEKKNRDTEKEKEKETKVKKTEITPEKAIVLNEMADKLLKGQISDTADYYAYCAKTDFNRSKLNKEIAEILAKRGDGRNSLQVIRDNKNREKQEAELMMSSKRIIY